MPAVRINGSRVEKYLQFMTITVFRASQKVFVGGASVALHDYAACIKVVALVVYLEHLYHII